MITNQDQQSLYNINYLKNEYQSIVGLKRKDNEYLLSQKLTQRCNYPTLKQSWDDRLVKNNYHLYLRERAKAEELAKATAGSVKKSGRQQAAKVLNTDDTQSEDANTNNPLS